MRLRTIRLTRTAGCWLALILSLGCAGPDPAAAPAPTAGGAPQPWSSAGFVADPDEFSFAVASDLTGGYTEGVFEAAVAKLNLLRPEFVMSVGDFIAGCTDDRAELARQWDEFARRLAPLDMRFFYAVGNHDIGNEVMKEVWHERLGRDYYHFVHRDVLFLVLNTEDPPTSPTPEVRERMQKVRMLRQANPEAALAKARLRLDSDDPSASTAMGGAIGEEQVRYFERVAAEHPDVRWTFLFLHRPIWQGDGNPALMRIEAALGDRPFTAFAGHLHNYRYFDVDGRMHIRMGTTGGGWLAPGMPGNFDHFAMVTMTAEGPRIANLLLEGILDETGSTGSDEDRLWRLRQVVPR